MSDKIKVIFWCDNGANIHSKKRDTVDFDREEWEEMTERERDQVVEEWALQQLNYGYEEAE